MTPFTIAVVCEAPADAHTAQILVDELLCRDVDWIELDAINDHRRYCGYQSPEPLLWRQIRKLADVHSVIVSGRLAGQLPNPDSVPATKALLLFDKCKPRPDAVLFIRDSDNDSTRRTGLEQARNHVPTTYPVIIGFAHTKRECWVIAGFHPASENEESRIAELRGDYPPGIGFDPRHRSDELTAKNTAKLCAKRVLLHLTSGNHDREHHCLIAIVKAKLHESRGQNNGLQDFIHDIEARLIPLITGRVHA